MSQQATQITDPPLSPPTDGGRRPRVRAFVLPVIPLVVAVGGFLTYGGLAFAQVHAQPSILDEGLYLYKGFLFASGRYVPFADGGPWTNHMPLAFLVPGWIQQVFGLGLRTGRAYALIAGLLMLLGVWINSRRLGGWWWAAAAVWVIALNPIYIQLYSQAQSQVLVACVLAWVLVLTLGHGRRPWEVVVGTGLAALLLGIRINLLPLLPLLLLYVFWQHGRRTGVWAAAVGVAVFGGFHMWYWPGILKLWAKWLPGGLTPFLDGWRESPSAIPAWDPQISFEGRLASLVSGLQGNLAATLGLTASLVAWPGTPWSQEQKATRRAAVFLLALALSLTALHAWAALGNSYCVYCFRGYLAFFGQVGVYLLVIAGAHWFPRLAPSRKIVTLLVLLLIGTWFATDVVEKLARHLRSVRLPRMAGLRLLPGETTLAGMLKSRFHVATATTDLALNAAVFLGALVVVALLLWIGISWAKRRPASLPMGGLSLALGAWLAALSLGFGTSTGKVCAGDVIQAYELAGEHLAADIPAGATVYWAGSLSPAPLLYIPEARIFPAQLNGDYTYRLAGDPDELRRFGSWNAEMASEWLAESDFVLVNMLNPGDAVMLLDLSDFDEDQPSPPTLPCQPKSIIRVFRRNP